MTLAGASLTLLFCAVAQGKREWVDKPDGAIVVAGPKAGPSFRRPTTGVDYYELLQVCGC